MFYDEKQTVPNIIMRSIFGFFGVVTIAFLIFDIIYHQRPQLLPGYCEKIEAWTVVREDGSEIEATVPVLVNSEVGEPLLMKSVLPEIIENPMYVCVTSGVDIKVSIGGEERFYFDDNTTDLIGKMQKAVSFFIKVTPEDSGKEIIVTKDSPEYVNGNFGTVYIGNGIGLFRQFCSFTQFSFFISLLIMTACFIFAFFAGIYALFTKKKMQITALIIAVMFATGWLTFESGAVQFELNIYFIDGVIAYMMALLIPFPLLVYTNAIQKNRYKKMYQIAEGISLVFAALMCFLNFTEIAEFTSNQIIIEIFLALVVVFIVFTIVTDFASEKYMEYKFFIYGAVFMFLCSSCEIVLIHVTGKNPNGILFLFGVVLLLVFAVIQQVASVNNIDKERRMAIAASESKTAFLANMSHEIRTPINSIIGMNEMILRECHDEQILEYAQNVERAGKTLLGLVNDVLDFSKIEAGKMEILDAPYDTASVMGDCLAILKERAAVKDLEVRFGMDENIPKTLIGDEVRVRQIITNLLSNATKYTQKGSVTFAVSALEGDVEGMCTLKISVSDTGIGIKEENIDHLFDTFSRFDLGKNRSIEGTGLGLGIVKRLVDGMGGNITVESQYNYGTRFMVFLPQKYKDKTPVGNLEVSLREKGAAKKKYRERFHAPNGKILVVDDNATNLLIVKKLLKATQLQIDTADGGRKALSMCEDKVYDLILMDHLMPEIDGIRTLHLLREGETRNKKTKVIALTANAIEGIKDMYLKEGFSDYLSKPIDPALLEEKLLEYLPKESIEAIMEQ